LINFDEIREKNKPKQPVETNVSTPFFLEFDNRFSSLASKMEGKIEEEKPAEEKLKTKIVRKENRNQFLEEVASNLEKLVIHTKDQHDPEAFNQMFAEMKKLTPAQVDYEIRMMTFGKLDKIETLLNFFNYLFTLPSDYDLKQIYFNNFLKICSDQMISTTELKEKIQTIRKNIDLHWRTLSDQINSNICMVQHFAKIKT